MKVLGIETSCDETGIAIYDSEKGLLSHQIYSQIDIHAPFGGVVPELASRDHIRKIVPITHLVLEKAGLSHKDINGIAYTKGPGLIGALLVGAMLGRTLGYAWQIPTVGVHHLEGHLLAPFLESNPPAFPFLALLVSGGHTELIKAEALGKYTVIGDTVDDAVGEAFDKTAKLLGLGYPGGAALAKLAEQGDPKRFHFPRPMVDRPGLDFSFSGLKTFALTTVKAAGVMPAEIPAFAGTTAGILSNPVILSAAKDQQTRADIARAFQDAVVDTLTIKCKRALRETKYSSLVVAGGVGANLALRQSLKAMSADNQVSLYFPRHEFCTDNGAMIAYVGCQRLLQGQQDNLSVEVFPRWDISSL